MKKREFILSMALALQIMTFEQKSIMGSFFGIFSYHTAMALDLKIDKPVTHKFKLEDLNEMTEMMKIQKLHSH